MPISHGPLELGDDEVLRVTETGEGITDPREDRALLRFSGRLVGGRVVQGGLGLGVMRHFLHLRQLVTRIRTFEARQDVIEFWRRWKGQHPAVPDSPEDATHEVSRATIQQALRTAAQQGLHPWDSAWIHVSEDLAQDSQFRQDLRTVFHRPGHRLVLVAYREQLQLAGWTTHAIGDPLEGGARVWACDRYQPDAGIGAASIEDTHMRVPGAGWVALEDIEGRSEA